MEDYLPFTKAKLIVVTHDTNFPQGGTLPTPQTKCWSIEHTMIQYV